MAATRDPIESMAPWDAAPYFQLIREFTVAVPFSGTVRLCRADPNRVALVVSASGATGATMSLNSNAAAQSGMSLGTSTLPIMLLFFETGPLCQQEWFGLGTGGGTFTVYEISLREWPKLKLKPKGGKRANAQRTAQRNRNGR